MSSASSPDDGTAFDHAASRFVAAIEASDYDSIAPDDYHLVLRTLTRFAQSYGRLSGPDAEEVAADTLSEAFARASGRGGIRQPSPYLFWTVRNRIRDRYRRAKTLDETEYLVESLEHTPGAEAYSSEDEAIVRLLDRGATAELVEDALRAAAAADDRLLIRVATVWLELAETLGRPPRSREVAPEAGVSHTSVNQALRRLRGFFPAQGDPASTS
jgi:DNA-directed RNA polymerase specialized sigma24 family protein